MTVKKPEQVGGVPELLPTNVVEYAQPIRMPPHSVWSVVGLAVAILSMFPPAMMWWVVARSVFFPPSSAGNLRDFAGVTINVGTAPLLPVISICLCLIGLQRGRKGLAVPGIMISIAAMLAMGVFVIKPSW